MKNLFIGFLFATCMFLLMGSQFNSINQYQCFTKEGDIHIYRLNTLTGEVDKAEPEDLEIYFSNRFNRKN